MPKLEFTKLGFYSDHVIHLVSPTMPNSVWHSREATNVKLINEKKMANACCDSMRKMK